MKLFIIQLVHSSLIVLFIMWLCHHIIRLWLESKLWYPARKLSLHDKHAIYYSLYSTDVHQFFQEESWSFSSPVSLAPSVETICTPPLGSTHSSPNYLMESLWFACGAQGVKVFKMDKCLDKWMEEWLKCWVDW